MGCPLRAEAARCDMVLASDQTDRLWTYLDLLDHWGKRLRLTGARDTGTLIRRHFADACALSQLIDASQGANTALDVGSGGGWPAIPTAILRPELALTLVESRSRKSAFLREVIAELELSASVIQTRFETVSVKAHHVWSLATFAPQKWRELGESRIERPGALYIFASGVAQDLEPDMAAADEHHYTNGMGDARRLVRLCFT